MHTPTATPSKKAKPAAALDCTLPDFSDLMNDPAFADTLPDLTCDEGAVDLVKDNKEVRKLLEDNFVKDVSNLQYVKVLASRTLTFQRAVRKAISVFLLYYLF